MQDSSDAAIVVIKSSSAETGVSLTLFGAARGDRRSKSYKDRSMSPNISLSPPSLDVELFILLVMHVVTGVKVRRVSSSFEEIEMEVCRKEVVDDVIIELEEEEGS